MDSQGQERGPRPINQSFIESQLKGQTTQGHSPSPYQNPERPACCYHELKSPKPRLGFFLATGTAALVEGSSSATRFLGREAADKSCHAGTRPRAGSPDPPSFTLHQGTPSSQLMAQSRAPGCPPPAVSAGRAPWRLT